MPPLPRCGKATARSSTAAATHRGDPHGIRPGGTGTDRTPETPTPATLPRGGTEVAAHTAAGTGQPGGGAHLSRPVPAARPPLRRRARAAGGRRGGHSATPPTDPVSQHGVGHGGHSDHRARRYGITHPARGAIPHPVPSGGRHNRWYNTGRHKGRRRGYGDASGYRTGGSSRPSGFPVPLRTGDSTPGAPQRGIIVSTAETQETDHGHSNPGGPGIDIIGTTGEP